MDPGHSRFTVQAFAGGFLSFLGHSPTFAVRNFEGELRWQPDTSEGAGLDVIVRADSLELLDNVRPADRAEIESRMKREVLESHANPEIRFESAEFAAALVVANRYRFRAAGMLSLRGVTNRHVFEAELLLFDDGVRLGGGFPLRMSEYRIRPVTALGGSIQLRDQVQVSFDIVALEEAS
jgi:polyisoprenoid-binding protein YceI